MRAQRVKEYAMAEHVLARYKPKKTKSFDIRRFVDDLYQNGVPLHRDMTSQQIKILGIFGNFRYSENFNTAKDREKESKRFRSIVDRDGSEIIALLEAVKKTKLLDDKHIAFPALRTNINNGSYIDCLKEVLTWKHRWIRDPSTWKCNAYSPAKAFVSLLDHLFCEYPVPYFMNSAFTPYETNLDTRHIYQEWFIEIGSGTNFRKCDNIPIQINKRMAHLFINGPSDLSISNALRWAQACGMGCTDAAARAIIDARIGMPHRDEEFFKTVIEFIGRHGMLDPAQIGPIIDYIRDQRFGPQNHVIVDGQAVRPPAERPGFSMKNRDMNTLLEQVERWHERLAKAKTKRNYSWETSGIRGFEKIEGDPKKRNQRIWRIDEILSSQALNKEGSDMHHCVGSYAASCLKGHRAIFSMTHISNGCAEKQVTISVNAKSKCISEIRQKRNAYPTERQMRIIREWASMERLIVSTYS